MSKWIPVTERLPKEYETVLVCHEKKDGYEQLGLGFYYTIGRKNGGWDLWADNIGDVIAWMPLPKPYKERKEE